MFVHYAGCWEAPQDEAPLVVGRDELSRTLVRLRSDARGFALDRPFSVWLPYDGFEPTPLSALSFPPTSVRTAVGLIAFCVPVEARLEGVTPPTGVIHVAFDPTERGAPHYPFDAAITTALEADLLRDSQRDSIRFAESEVETNHKRLVAAFRELVQASLDHGHQRRFIDALTQIHRLRTIDSGTFTPAAFLDRQQREAVRARGVSVEGRCRLDVWARHVIVELSACPWVQLARTWNDDADRLGAAAGRLAVREDFEFSESPDLTLSMTGDGSAAAHQLALDVLAGLPGLEIARR